jgi:hypothetical protein
MIIISLAAERPMNYLSPPGEWLRKDLVKNPTMALSRGALVLSLIGHAAFFLEFHHLSRFISNITLAKN